MPLMYLVSLQLTKRNHLYRFIGSCIPDLGYMLEKGLSYQQSKRLELT